ncbi:hypothetical protein [Marinobacter xestospongiae]|uniref:BlaR1 peptidase M56 n=1 Tax=Marinobacter xestospongiae TaxID=994319 RepID=A0ABU3VZP5_9GAMM|nr:hypothetical protein [Marinobacter xestospongiae]MDV2079759.1 hypothetical protein [Marinobacter xestospongiae]
MMNAEAQLAYGIFWGIYILGFLVFFYVMSRFFRLLPLYGLRTLLQAVLIVAIATPVESAEVAGWWIPAWLHGGYEAILGNAEEAARAFFNMGLAAMVMTLVWLLDLVRYRLTRR